MTMTPVRLQQVESSRAKPASEDRDYLRVIVLPQRMLEVFFEVVEDGADNQTIAKRLFVSVDTVKTHLARVLKRADCRTRTELVARWYRGQITVIPPSSPWREPPLSYETFVRSERVRQELGR